MWTYGMTAAQVREMQAVLDSHHEVTVRVYVLDLEHRYMDDVSGLLVDGQVDNEWAALATQEYEYADASGEADGVTCQLTLVDPGRTLGWVGDSPSQMGSAPSRMLRIFYAVRRPPSPGVPAPPWFEIPVFTGPVVGAVREDAVVTLNGSSKIRLWRHTNHGARTWHKGAPARDVLVGLQKMAGEPSSMCLFPPSTATLPHAISMAWSDDLWARAQQVAGVMGMHLYVNGWGSVIARRYRKFAAGAEVLFDGSNTVGQPSGSLGVNTALVNRWVVNGQAPGGDKPAPLGYANLPKSHPLSAWSLGRYGKSIVYDDTRTTDARTEAQARIHAESARDSATKYDPAEVSWEGLPHPELEPWDTVRIVTPQWGQYFTLSKWSLPLRVGSPAQYGATKRVSLLGQRGTPVSRTGRLGATPVVRPLARGGSAR